MASDPSLPLDLAACHELIRRLTDQNAEQRRVLDEVDASYHELQQERDLLKAELEQFRRWAYGRRTERIREADGQRHLFELEPGVLPWPSVEDVSLEETPASPRRKKRRSQKDKLAHLPTRIIPLDVPEEDKHCDTCGREKAKIGEDERRVLHYRPAVLDVEVYVLPKYACPCCQSGVVSPPPPERILPRSIAGPGLISEILVSKFYDHLPLYRQEDRLTRLGLYLSRSTLCDWAGVAADLLKPLYDRIVKLVLGSNVIWTDDTLVRMLDPKAEGGSRLARFWTYISDDPFLYSVYDFTDSRKRDGPASFLKDYHGAMHADAYGGYDGIITGSNGAIVRVACGAHPPQIRAGEIERAARECADAGMVPATV